MLRGIALSRGMVLSLIAGLLISACGGGGGSGPAPDTTPEVFNFAAATDQEPSATVTSSAVTITGINRETPVSVSGGSYSLDGGTTFGTEAVTLQNNQSVLVRGTAAAAYATPVTVTLTVGEVSADFVITTRAKDTTPAAFSFAPTANQDPNAEVNSAPITITDIDADVALSVSNGSYSLDNGSSFVTEATTINNEQTVIVQGTAPADFATSETVTLTVGTVSQDFVITTRARDITPDELAEFSPVTDADPSTEYTSNTITVNGVEGNVAVTITNGSYAIDDSETFITEAGEVSNGQTLRVRTSSAEAFDTPVTATLSVGSVTRDFVVTAVEDTTPAALGFSGTLMGLALGETVTSEVLTVSGINTAASVAITGGEFQIIGNEAGYVTEGNVVAGEQIQVRAVAPATAGSSRDVVLTVGTVAETWTLQSIVDQTPPTVSIAFPPPASLTEGDTIYVRGTASDDLSGVQSLQVNDLDVEDTSDDGSFSTWQVTVPLEPGENTLRVSASDGSANVDADAASVLVRSDAALGDFPDSVNPLANPQNFIVDYSVEPPRGITVSRANNQVLAVDLATGARLVLSAADQSATGNNDFLGSKDTLFNADYSRFWATSLSTDPTLRHSIIEIDLNTGARMILTQSDFDAPLEEIPFFGSGINAMIQDVNDPNRILVADVDFGVTAVNMENGARSVFATSSTSRPALIPEDDPISFRANNIAYDVDQDRYILISSLSDEVLAVDAVSGRRALLASNTFPEEESGPILDVQNYMAFDEVRRRVLIPQSTSVNPEIIAVNVDTGERSLFSNTSTPNSFNQMNAVRGSHIDENFGYLFLADDGAHGILAIDLVTGYRVYISKAGNP